MTTHTQNNKHEQMHTQYSRVPTKITLQYVHIKESSPKTPCVRAVFFYHHRGRLIHFFHTSCYRRRVIFQNLTEFCLHQVLRYQSLTLQDSNSIFP